MTTSEAAAFLRIWSTRYMQRAAAHARSLNVEAAHRDMAIAEILFPMDKILRAEMEAQR